MERVSYAKSLVNQQLADRMMRDNGLNGAQVLLLRRAAMEKDYSGVLLDNPGELNTYNAEPKDLEALREHGWVRREHRNSPAKRNVIRTQIRALLEEASQKLGTALSTQDEQKYRASWYSAYQAITEANRLQADSLLTVLKITDKGRRFVREFEVLLTRVGDFEDVVN